MDSIIKPPNLNLSKQIQRGQLSSRWPMSSQRRARQRFTGMISSPRRCFLSLNLQPNKSIETREPPVVILRMTTGGSLVSMKKSLAEGLDLDIAVDLNLAGQAQVGV